MSHHGPYKFIRFDFDTPILVPCNPVGRTGIIGRGHLGRWGPNHAAGNYLKKSLFKFELTKRLYFNLFCLDPIVTQ